MEILKLDTQCYCPLLILVFLTMLLYVLHIVLLCCSIKLTLICVNVFLLSQNIIFRSFGALGSSYNLSSTRKLEESSVNQDLTQCYNSMLSIIRSS